MGQNDTNPNDTLTILEDWFRAIIRDEISRVFQETKSKPVITETYLSIKEAALKLSVNRSTLDRWTTSGLLIRHKVGGRRLYKLSEIESFVNND